MNANLEELFRAEFPRVAKLVASIVRDPGRAEELAVEAFLKWSQAKPQSGNASAFLTRSAARLALDELRRQSRWQRIERLIAVWRTPVATPEELHAAGEEQARVRAVLASMKPGEAELLLLRNQGLSYQQLSAALSLNPASVGQMLARAQQNFRKEYVKRYGEQWRLGSCELGR